MSSGIILIVIGVVLLVYGLNSMQKVWGKWNDIKMQKSRGLFYIASGLFNKKTSPIVQGGAYMKALIFLACLILLWYALKITRIIMKHYTKKLERSLENYDKT